MSALRDAGVPFFLKKNIIIEITMFLFLFSLLLQAHGLLGIFTKCRCGKFGPVQTTLHTGQSYSFNLSVNPIAIAGAAR